MSKTVKQLADELNVSKTAIRKRLTPEFKAQYVETDDAGSLQVSAEGCKLISESFRKVTENQRKQAETDRKPLPETTENQSLQAILDAHRETVAALQAQIDSLTADKELLNEELIKERTHARELADKLAEITAREQGLHAGTLLTDKHETEEQGTVIVEQAETVAEDKDETDEAQAQTVDAAEDPAKKHRILETIKAILHIKDT